MKNVFLCLTIALLAACSGGSDKPDEQPVEQDATASASASASTDESAQEFDLTAHVEAAATGDHRSAENIARNEHRHPVETLTFFGIEPDMTVVEFWSGGGWYTEVLAPTVNEGTVVAANFAAKDDPEHYRSKLRVKMDERVKTDPVFSNVVHGTLEPGVKVDAGEPGSADMVLTFRNIHSYVRAGIEKQMFAEAYKLLKPGGIFGVVQHRAKADVTDVKASAETGYVPESFVIDLAEETGFELVEKSEINANPKDTTDWEEGVWTLPPSYRLGDKDKAKYEAIGESDRMTLKFRKPAQ